MIIPWVTEAQKEAEEIDVRQAYAYYCTPRGQHPCSPNKLRYVSLAYVMAFDALHGTDKFLTQPLQIIVGDKIGAFGSYHTGLELYEKAASKEKDLYIIEGASHYDLYDNPRTVDQAVSKLTAFYRKNLA